MLTYSTNYNKEFVSRMFLIEQEIMQDEEMFLIESISLLQEGIIKSVTKGTVKGASDVATGIGSGVTKSVGGHVKKFFESFIAAIKGVFKRFVENITHLFKSHEKWLRDNESYIMNADLSDYHDEIFPYWEEEETSKKLTSIKILEQDIKTLVKKKADDKAVREFYMKRLGISSNRINTEDKAKFTEDLKVYLRGGGSRIIKENEIRNRIPGIFTYCKNYASMHKDVQKAINDIEYFCKRADKLFKINNTELANQNQQKAADPNTAKENKQTLGESFYFFSEEQPSLKDSLEKQGKTTDPTSLSKKIENNDKKEKTEEEKRKEVEEKENTFVKQNASQTQGDEIAMAKTMLNTVMTFITVRMELIEEKFKVYMRFLRRIARRSMGQSKRKQANGNSVNNGNIVERTVKKVAIHTKK